MAWLTKRRCRIPTFLSAVGCAGHGRNSGSIFVGMDKIERWMARLGVREVDLEETFAIERPRGAARQQGFHCSDASSSAKRYPRYGGGFALPGREPQAGARTLAGRHSTGSNAKARGGNCGT